MRDIRRRGKARAGLTLIESLLVIAIVVVLLGLAMPVLTAARLAARSAQCQNNLRMILAFTHMYADESKGYLPRDGLPTYTDRPNWPTAYRTLMGRAYLDRPLETIETYHCPDHPDQGALAHYSVNAFAFESAPLWTADGLIRITHPRQHSDLIWFAESADEVLGTPQGLRDLRYVDFWKPGHLPNGWEPRLTERRHRGGHSANVAYLDGHALAVAPGQMMLKDFDDRSVQRYRLIPLSRLVTPPPPTP